MLKKLDPFFIDAMSKHGIKILRIALGIIFVWFGGLKLFGVSPVIDLLDATYPFMAQPTCLMALGLLEIIIGLGLIFKLVLRVTLTLLWLQMLGTLFTFVLAPSMFFDGNILKLTMEGEFVVKNLVFIAAGLVIAGHEVKPRA